MVNGSLRERMRARVRAAVLGALSAGLGSLAAVGPAAAGTGQPSPKQIGFQEAVTPVAHDIHWLHDYVNIIIFAITAFVLVLMLYVMWRFSEKRNPVALAHHAQHHLEVLWTVIPVLILVAIAIPSFKLLFFQYSFPPPDLTIKAIGHAWNWTHEYPGQGHQRRFGHPARQRARRGDQGGHAGRPGSAQPRRRQRGAGAGQQGRARAGHVHRRDPRLDRSLLRLEGGRRSRPHHRDLVQGREGRHLLRPVLRAVRQGPRLHADRHPRREGRGLRGVGRGGEGARQAQGQGDRPQAANELAAAKVADAGRGK